jgi:hypothetical protein
MSKLVEKIDAVIKSIHLSTRTGKERQEMARAILAVMLEEMRERSTVTGCQGPTPQRSPGVYR